jgi:hypothetical protein
LGVASFSLRDNKSYYLVVIEGGPRDSISFSGIQTEFKENSVEREVLSFHIRGPLIEALALTTYIQDVGKISIDCSFDEPDIPEQHANVNFATVPFLSCDKKSPHGAVLRITGLKNQEETVVTLADFKEGFGILEAFVVVACVAIITAGAPQIIRSIKDGKVETGAETDIGLETPWGGKLTYKTRFFTGAGSASRSGLTDVAQKPGSYGQKARAHA